MEKYKYCKECGTKLTNQKYSICWECYKKAQEKQKIPINQKEKKHFKKEKENYYEFNNPYINSIIIFTGSYILGIAFKIPYFKIISISISIIYLATQNETFIYKLIQYIYSKHQNKKNPKEEEKNPPHLFEKNKQK